MNKERPMSELNLHFMALLTMIYDFKKNTNLNKYFENDCINNISLRKANLLYYKIHQILTLMIDHAYYYDSDISIDQLQSILQLAFSYIEELYDWKLDKEE